MKHECVYQTLSGGNVSPVVISETFIAAYPNITKLLDRNNYMQPLGLYRCHLCDRFLYITADSTYLHLIRDPKRNDMP
jgi:hypothetical protein